MEPRRTRRDADDAPVGRALRARDGSRKLYLGRTALAVLGTCAVLAAGCRSSSSERDVPEPPADARARAPGPREDQRHAFFGAVALGLFGHPDDPQAADEDMASIAAMGATGIVLPVFWSSPDATSTAIEPFRYGVPQEAYDRAIVAIAARARARGLAFELLPIVRLERLGPGDWRGTLRPSDWEAWWIAYRRFILHQAEVAERAGADLFCVGSELGSTETQTERWERLIGDVRKLTRARLIYSANWDHYREVLFWHRLDGVGLSAYHELADGPGASQERLDAAWRAHRDAILAWARPLKRPLYLTEVGYPAQSGAAVHPWDYTRRDAPDPEAQARCFRAFSRAWRDVPDLAGVTIWIWDHGKGGPEDDSYAIAGKPAAAVVRDFFLWRARTPSPPR